MASSKKVKDWSKKEMAEAKTRLVNTTRPKRKRGFPLRTVFFYGLLVSIALLLYSINSHQGVSFLGYRLLTVLSDSMTPTFAIGDVIITRKVAPEALKEDDIITFKLTEKEQVTHRIMSILDEGTTFITKGDANENNDFSPVKPDQLIGKNVGKIKYLGKLLLLMRQPAGLIALVLTCLFLLNLKQFIKILTRENIP